MELLLELLAIDSRDVAGAAVALDVLRRQLKAAGVEDVEIGGAASSRWLGSLPKPPTRGLMG